MPALATALWAPGQVGKPEAAQHVGQVYSHLPHTEPSYPKQDRKEQKQRVSESTAQAGAGSPGPRKRGCYSDRQMDMHTPPSGKRPGSCVCVCVLGKGGDEAVNCWSSGTLHLGYPGPSSGEGTPDSPRGLMGLTYWRRGRAAPVTKGGLPWSG